MENPLMLIVMALFGLIVLGLYIWSIVWAYRDAESRGKPGLLIALMIALLSWPISLLVWIAFRPER